MASILGQGAPPQVAPKADDRADKPRPSRSELEARLKQTLTGAVLKGSWQMTDEQGLAGKAPLGEPREDRYTIASAEKDDDQHWIIAARLQFAEKDVTLPVRVRVEWAGDTPVITLDDVTFPMIGTYSARVMIYRNMYCGTWFGPNYGGVMSGQIVQQEDEAAAGGGAATQPARPNGAP